MPRLDTAPQSLFHGVRLVPYVMFAIGMGVEKLGNGVRALPPLCAHSKLRGFRTGSPKLLFNFELLVTIQILNFYEEGSLTCSRQLTSFLSRHLGYP